MGGSTRKLDCAYAGKGVTKEEEEQEDDVSSSCSKWIVVMEYAPAVPVTEYQTLPSGLVHANRTDANGLGGKEDEDDGDDNEGDAAVVVAVDDVIFMGEEFHDTLARGGGEFTFKSLVFRNPVKSTARYHRSWVA